MKRALIFFGLSIVPTLVQLFVVFPYQAGKGVAGLDLGVLTPAVVFGINWIYGVVTAFTIRYSR